MKKALISPIEPRETGYRVCDVKDAVFDVAEPFFWLDCADDMEIDTHWYDPETQGFVAYSVVESVTPTNTTSGVQTF